MRTLEEGIFWKGLYDKDVATRAELEDEVEADEDGGADDAAAKTVDKKIKALKKKMEKKFNGFEDKLRKKHEKKFRELKKEIKTLVTRFLDAQSRKSTNGTRRKSTMEKGECSIRTVVDEDEESEEEVEDLETEEESKEESEEESEEEAEEEAEEVDSDTTMAQFVKRRRLLRK